MTLIYLADDGVTSMCINYALVKLSSHLGEGEGGGGEWGGGESGVLGWWMTFSGQFFWVSHEGPRHPANVLYLYWQYICTSNNHCLTELGFFSSYIYNYN